MIKLSITLPMLLLLILINSINAYSCAVFNISNKYKVLVGNNEGWFIGSSPGTIHKIKFIPPSKGKIGRVLLISQTDNFESIEGGMNQYGLCFDGAALATSPKMTRDKSKREIPDNLNSFSYLLERYQTVQEVKKFIDSHNWEDALSSGQLMFIDQDGYSSVFCSNKNGDIVSIDKKLNNSATYQLMTNFNLANPDLDPEEKECWRFKIGINKLSKVKKINIRSIAEICDAMAQKDSFVKTLYGTVYDLKNKAIYVFNGFNFNEYVKFDLESELSKGEHTYIISSLFVSNSEKNEIRSDIQRDMRLYK